MKPNPYKADGVPYKPWVAYDYHHGQKVIMGRYAWRWLAKLFWLGTVEVEYAPE